MIIPVPGIKMQYCFILYFSSRPDYSFVIRCLLTEGIMFRSLFLIFLIVPLIEIYLLIKVGGVIGALPTVALVVLTAVLGAGLLRWQGFATMQRVRLTLARGELPAIEMLEGVVLLCCGALLLTPGFFTDTLGFIGLVPAVRRQLILWLLNKGLISRHTPTDRHDGPGDRHGHKTIEGEFWRDK